MAHCRASGRRAALAHRRVLMPPPPGERFLILFSQPEVIHADITEICHGEPQGARMIPHAYLSNTEQLSRERDAIVKIGTYLDGAKRSEENTSELQSPCNLV